MSGLVYSSIKIFQYLCNYNNLKLNCYCEKNHKLNIKRFLIKNQAFIIKIKNAYDFIVI